MSDNGNSRYDKSNYNHRIDRMIDDHEADITKMKGMIEKWEAKYDAERLSATDINNMRKTILEKETKVLELYEKRNSANAESNLDAIELHKKKVAEGFYDKPAEVN
jgi:hypothetical protein